MLSKCNHVSSALFLAVKKLVWQYKYWLLLFVALMLVSIITGIVTCSGYASDLKPDNIINKYLLDFLSNESNFLSFFLIMSVFYIAIILLTIIFSHNKFMLFSSIAVFMFVTYIFAFDFCIIIVTLGLAGIILGILFYFLLGICVFCVYSLILSIISSHVFARIKCKYSRQDWLLFLVLIIASLLILFLLCFLFSLIHIFVIIE